MNAILITYDLVAPMRDYDDLIKKIKNSYSDHEKITESVWIVETNKTASEVFDEIKPYTDKDDRLFVAKISGEAKWKRNILGDSDNLKEIL